MRSSTRAFTLIELLCVITIIALLASLIMPAVGTIMGRTDGIKCINNLRQLAAAAHFAAQDNGGVFPNIETDPSSPTFSPDSGAKSLYESLKKYGITEKGVQCPVDLKRDKQLCDYTKRGSSYFWYPYSDEAEETAIIVYGRRRAGLRASTKVPLLSDWSAIHPTSLGPGSPQRFNMVYADGRILAADAIPQTPAR